MGADGLALEEASVLKGHTDRVWCLDWTADGKVLASSGADKTIRVWAQHGSVWTCQCEVEEGHTRTIRSIAWSPSGDKLATASFDGTCIIWTFKNFELEQICTLQGHENEVKCVAWDPSGNLLATCSRDKSVWVWECMKDEEDDFECVAVLHGHSQDVKMVQWHPTKEVLVSASYDESIKIWQADEDDWACAHTLTGHSNTVWAVAFSPSGDRMVSVGGDMLVKFWKDDGSQGTIGAMYTETCSISGQHTRPVYHVDWCKGADLVATAGGDDAMRVFSPAESAAEGTKGDVWISKYFVPRAHVGDVNCVRWRPGVAGEQQIASGGDDGLIKIWRCPQ